MDKTKPKTKPTVFLGEVKEELQKVSWPTKDQAIGTSIVVFVVVVIITIYLGFVDMALSNIVSLILR